MCEVMENLYERFHAHTDKEIYVFDQKIKIKSN